MPLCVRLARHGTPFTKNTSNFMGNIYNNIIETVGRTPLVKLNRIPASEGVDPSTTIALKCEFFNPLGSVKDRIGAAMI